MGKVNMSYSIRSSFMSLEGAWKIFRITSASNQGFRWDLVSVRMSGFSVSASHFFIRGTFAEDKSCR